MIHILVVCEGQTESRFIRDVTAPVFLNRNMEMAPRLIPTSPSTRGGALKWNRVSRGLRNTLRERTDTYVTTFFDLYKLDTNFPGAAESLAIRNPLDRSRLIETALADQVVADAKCRPERFVPHIQPFEFESLLFSDVARFSEVHKDWIAFVDELGKARASVSTPEHINDGPTTHPSARLAKLAPRYKKVIHGSEIARRIGLDRIRNECAHFSEWLARLERLPPLNVVAV